MMLATAPVRKVRFVENAPENAFWRTLHALADGAYPGVAREVLALLREAGAQVDTQALASLLTAQNRVGAEALLQTAWEHVSPSRVAAVTEKLEALALKVAAQTEVAGIAVAFNVEDREAVRLIRQGIGRQVVAIDTATRAGITRIIEEAFTAGTPLTAQIERLAAMVGLTPTQVESLAHYEAGLIDAGESPARVARLVQERTDVLRRRRAEAIARTETINAATAGQQARWEQMEHDGLIDAGARRFWIVTPDDRLCPICAAIPGMNPEGVRLREAFQTPGGPRQGPTAHPQCRCAVSLRTGLRI